jgi:hypothetical protein
MEASRANGMRPGFHKRVCLFSKTMMAGHKEKKLFVHADIVISVLEHDAMMTIVIVITADY